MLIKNLTKLGLTEKEATVYLALLEIGENSAYDLSKKAGLNHSTVYVVLKGLMKKGIAIKSKSKHSTIFKPLEPEELYHLIDQKRKELDFQERELTKNISALTAIHLASQKQPEIRFYQGQAGLAQLEADANLADKFATPDTFSFTPLDVFEELDLVSATAAKRLERGQKLKVIYTHKKGIQRFSDPNLLREARFLPVDKYPFQGTVVIAPNHSLRLFSYKKDFNGIWINNPYLANTLKTIFDFCWINAIREDD